MKTYYTVYKITNMINDEYYIGKHQTQNLDDDYMGSGRLLQKQFQEHGMKWFKKEILHIFETEEEMNLKEAELVDTTDPKSLNLCPGGHGGFGYINKHEKATEWRSKGAKNRIALHGNPASLPQSKKASAENLRKYNETRESFDTFSGRKHTKETKIKISETMSKLQSGKNNSQYGTMWITNGVDNCKIKCYDNIPDGWYKGRK